MIMWKCQSQIRIKYFSSTEKVRNFKLAKKSAKIRLKQRLKQERYDRRNRSRIPKRTESDARKVKRIPWEERRRES